MLWLLIGYMYLFIHRPFEIWPILGACRLEFVYMLLTGAVWAMSPGKRWLANRLHLAFFTFAAAVLVCWVVSPWCAEISEGVLNYFRVLVFYVILVSVVHEEKSLKRVTMAYLVFTAIYMLHSLWEFRNGRHVFRMGIVRLVGVDATMNNPNAFGASILFALVFVPPLWISYTSKKWHYFLAGYVALSIMSIGLTGSRASFVGLVLVAIVAILRSRWRASLLMAAVILAPLLWTALPPSLQTRFETIIYPEVGPLNAKESAEGRIEGFLIGLKLWQENPVTGIGPGAWRPATHRDVESHNLYGQLLGEMGTLGAVTFGAVLLAIWLNLRKINQAYRSHPEWGHDFIYYLAKSIGLAFFLLLFEGTCGHNLFRYNWLWFGGFLIIARFCIEQRLQEQRYEDESDFAYADDDGFVPWGRSRAAHGTYERVGG